MSDWKTNFCNKFWVKTFRVTVANTKIGSLKSLLTLFDMCWTTCWWNLNKIVWSEIGQNFEFFNRKSFDATLEDVSIAETIVECKTIDLKTTIFQRSKYYVSTTLLTSTDQVKKIASNMVDPIYILRQYP